MKKTITFASAAVLGGLAAIPFLVSPATTDAGTVGAARPASGGYRHDLAATGRPGQQRKYTPLSKRSRAAAGPSHQITFHVLDRHGRAPATDDAPEVYLIPLDGGEWLSAPLENGTATGALPAGEYIVQAYVGTPENGGVRSTTMIYLARHAFRADEVLTLDARTSRPVSAVIGDRPDARVLDGTVSIDQEVGGEVITDLAGIRPVNGYITAAGPAPGLRTRMQAHLTANGAESGSPYLHSVARRFEGIPADPTAQQVVLSVETWADGETAPAKVEALAFSVSVDDGATWTPVALRRDGDRWLATVRNPAAKYVSFRARARTADGTAVDQTVINAYLVR